MQVKYGTTTVLRALGGYVFAGRLAHRQRPNQLLTNHSAPMLEVGRLVSVRSRFGVLELLVQVVSIRLAKVPRLGGIAAGDVEDQLRHRQIELRGTRTQ